MKLLIVASWFPTPSSPVAGIFVAEQAAALSARHDVTVLAPEMVAAGSPVGRTIENADGFRVVRIQIAAGRHTYALRYAWCVLGEMRRGAYDIAHAHVTLPAGFASVLAGVAARRPSVITEHLRPFDRLLGSAGDRAKVRFALNRASVVIAVSEGLREQMSRAANGRPVLVVPNLINTRKFRPQPQAPFSDCGNLLFVGRLNDRQKNLPALLEAVAQANRKTLRFRLRIIGDGELRPEYEQRADHLGIRKLCEFSGFQPPAQVAQALAECHAFVLPSIGENCPVAVAEALAVGRPAIVTRCGGSEEMVPPECGAVVPVNDVEALADAIVRICGNLGIYSPEQISRYAHTRFGSEAVVDRLTHIYESAERGAGVPQATVTRAA